MIIQLNGRCVQAAYLTLVQRSSENHHKSTLELLHLNAFNTLPLFLTMSLLLGEPASVSASLLTEDKSFYVVFVILIREYSYLIHPLPGCGS